MKRTPSVNRVYDLAAMRGWRTIRLDRKAPPASQQAKSFSAQTRVLRKAA